MSASGVPSATGAPLVRCAALGPAVDIRFVARCRWHKGHFRRIEGIGDEAGSLR